MWSFSSVNLSYPLTNNCSKPKTGLIQATCHFCKVLYIFIISTESRGCLLEPLLSRFSAPIFVSSPSWDCPKLLFACYLLSAGLFSLLSALLKNVTNASRWKPEYPLHLSSLRHLGSSGFVSLNNPELVFVSLAAWDCSKLCWVLCLLASTFCPTLSLFFLPKIGRFPECSTENIGVTLMRFLPSGIWLLKSWIFWLLFDVL